MERTGTERSSFGLKVEDAMALSDWVLARVGYVVGSKGQGGCGVFVDAVDGRTAPLTARYVLVPAVLSGEVCVAFTNDARAHPVVESNALRMAARADACSCRIALLPLAPQRRRGAPPKHLRKRCVSCWSMRDRLA